MNRSKLIFKRVLAVSLSLSVVFSIFFISAFAAEDESYKVYNSFNIGSGQGTSGYSIEVPRTAYKAAHAFVCMQTNTDWTITAMDETASLIYQNGKYRVYRFNDVLSKTPARYDNCTITFKGTGWMTCYGVFAYPDTSSFQLSLNLGYSDSFYLAPNTASYTSYSANTDVNIGTDNQIIFKLSGFTSPLDQVTTSFRYTSGNNQRVPTTIAVFENDVALSDTIVSEVIDTDGYYQMYSVTLNNPIPGRSYYIRITFGVTGGSTTASGHIRMGDVYGQIRNMPTTDDYISWLYRDVKEMRDALDDIASATKDNRTWLQKIFDALNPPKESSNKFNTDINNKSDQLGALSGSLNSYDKPAVDDINLNMPDLGNDGVSGFNTILSTVFSNNLTGTVLTMAFVLAIAAYVLFGKR